MYALGDFVVVLLGTDRGHGLVLVDGAAKIGGVRRFLVAIDKQNDEGTNNLQRGSRIDIRRFGLGIVNFFGERRAPAGADEDTTPRHTVRGASTAEVRYLCI